MDEESKDLKLIRRLIELNESSALNGNDIFYLSAERLSFLSDKTEQQAETIERLNGVMNKVRDDLLERADIGNDGTRAVNLSHSVWLEFCDAIDKTN